MIYLEPSQLGWKPLVTSWLSTLPEPLNEKEFQDLFEDLFDWLVPPALLVRRKQCKVNLTFSQENDLINLFLLSESYVGKASFLFGILHIFKFV